MRNAPVLVTKDVESKVKVYYKNKELSYEVVTIRQKQEIKSAKEINRKVDELLRRKITRPAKDHPLRYFSI
jgi:hypothetical protein